MDCIAHPPSTALQRWTSPAHEDQSATAAVPPRRLPAGRQRGRQSFEKPSLPKQRQEMTMNDPLPRSISRPLQFTNGCAIGISNRWRHGQYCMILTEAGLVGCGIYDVKTAAVFGQAVAIARGTPQKPL